MKKITWICIFSIAMGYLEAAVVIYLRRLFYPEGFAFPLEPIDSSLSTVEFFREAATILMLVGAGYVAGKSLTTRFAWFIICFGIWDLAYYFFLWLFLDWPATLAEWDVLFLIPTAWIGPVWAPALVAICLCAFGTLILSKGASNKGLRIPRRAWIVLIAGAVIIMVSFCLDFSQFVLKQGSWIDLFSLKSTRGVLFDKERPYVPNRFYWEVFFIGLFTCAAGVYQAVFKRNSLDKQANSSRIDVGR